MDNSENKVQVDKNDEIDLAEIFYKIWQGKFIIILFMWNPQLQTKIERTTWRKSLVKGEILKISSTNPTIKKKGAHIKIGQKKLFGSKKNNPKTFKISNEI